MKKTLSIILALCMIISMLPQTAVFASAAESGTCGDNLTWVLDASGTLTISGSGKMYDYSYSSDVPWYSSNGSIKKVTIGDSVTTIGDTVFNSCTSLTSVTIPDSITTIGDYAFCNCTSLTSVTIGDGVTTIGDYAFYYCGTLASVTIPDSVTTIGDTVFNSCTSLTAIEVDIKNTAYCDINGVLFNKTKTMLVRYPEGKKGAYTISDSITTIGQSAFNGCTSLTSVTIPSSVTTIEYSAFYNCRALTSVTIPDSVTTIGDTVFNSCEALTAIEVDMKNTAYCDINGVLFNKAKTMLVRYPEGKKGAYTIPDSVTMIGNYAFDDCRALTSVTIPDSVTTIGYSAFCNCTSLMTVTIPDSVATIENYAFCNCTSLALVTIPSNVITIGDSVFSSCSALTAIEVDIKNTAYCDINGVLFNKTKTMLVQYPTGKKGVYTIPDSVTTIGDSVFSHCGALTSVTIPDSVTAIGDWAFFGCSALSDVYYGGGKEDWARISIGFGNDPLVCATIHYNSVSDDVPQITSITKLPETVDGQATVEAEVSGEDILSVHLNTKLCDAFGNEKTETVEMKPLAGIYTAKTPKIPTGCTARVWISAYNSLGNSTKSEEQEILSIKLSDSEPSIAITSVSQGTVEVKCKNLAAAEDASVLLAVYDAGGRLLYATEAPAEETVVFENVAQGEQIKAFLWQDMKPLCEATSAQKIK